VDEAGFRKALKKRGKKPHVVDGLVNTVKRFEDFLGKRRNNLENASEKDLQAYADVCEAEKKGSTKTRVRGIMLYYDFKGNNPMALLADSLREAQTAKTRKVFKLKDFLWVNLEHVAKLKELGIADVNQMVDAGRTPGLRKELSAKSGIPVEGILELVKLSNLAQQFAVKGVRARLYHDAGVDTWEKIAARDPREFRKMLIKFVEETGFPGIPPTPKEAAGTVAAAKKISKIVEW